MTQRNARGAYVNFTHDRAADWDWLRKWEPNVIRYMGQGSATDPNSFDVSRVKRIHETCPQATILLRCWEIDDNNFSAHDAMVRDPQGTAQKQVDWWARVLDRAGVIGVPRSLLMAGLNNETGPEKDSSLFLYTEAALKEGTQKQVRLGVYVFSVGRPSLPGEAEHTIDSFQKLDEAILANEGAIVLHEYLQPEGMYAVWTDEQGNERKDYTYLIGRHMRWAIKSPIIIGEWGIDGILYNRHPDPQYGNSGWRNFSQEWSPTRYADEYVECVRKASPNVIATCPFISDFADRKWASFDLLEAYEEFIARKDLCTRSDSPSDSGEHSTHIPSVGTGAKTKTMYVTAPNGLNLRLTPVTGDILIAVPYGTPVQVMDHDEDARWAMVRHEGLAGWMSLEYLQETPPRAGSESLPKGSGGDCWERSLAFIRKWEGGWAEDPNDPGGATNKGITIGTYIRWRDAQGLPEPSKEDLRNISDDEVRQIYRDWYWLASGANKLEFPLCLAHFNIAVNAGPGRAKEFLEKSGGDFNLYMAEAMEWYTRISGWKHFGAAWTRRNADVLREASKEL